MESGITSSQKQWYTRGLELRAKEDRLGRARSFKQLGSIALRRFLEACEAGRRPEEYAGHFSHAEQYYKQALDMTPANAVEDLASAHSELGILYGSAGQIDTALRHYREAIRYKESMQDRFTAGQTRYNAAATLSDAGRLVDAREWARSALRDFEACENAAQYVVRTLKFLEAIESDLRGTSRPS
jgi:tetratricopeptide (TPR) repeat protein